MTIDISNNAARVNYSVGSGVTQTSFAVPFEFFNDSDLSVYVDDVLKTITTHYTVSGGDGSTGTVTISVTGASGGSAVVISRSIDIERTSDFTSGVDINRAALNTQLDTLTAIAADNKDRAVRSITAPNSETNPSLELPSVANRKGKLLGFDDTTGNVVTTATLSDIAAITAISTDIGTLADIEDGTDATDAIQTVAAISSNVTTVAGNSANVTTVAGISADVTAVAAVAASVGSAAANATAAANSATASASSATDSGNSASGAASSAAAAANSASAAALALDSFDDRYLGSKTGFSTSGTGPSADNDGNALVEGALFFSADANEMRVYDGANWIAASSSGTASLIIYEFTATSAQTTFSGTDDNGATLGYTALNIIVSLNGVILDPSDYTASSGTSIVLASGAATGDLLNVYAFASFTVADTVSRANGGTFAAGITVQGNISVTGDANITSKIGLGGTNYGTAGQVIKSAGSGAAAVWGSAPAPFAPVAVTGTSQTLDIGSFNFFDAGANLSTTALTSVSFSNVPTNARFQYAYVATANSGVGFSLSAKESSINQFTDTRTVFLPYGVGVSENGSYIYIVDYYGDVAQFTLSTPYDVSTASLTRTLLRVNYPTFVPNQATKPSICWKDDGSRYFIAGENTVSGVANSNVVFSYDASSAFNISTFSNAKRFNCTAQVGTIDGLDVASDGSAFFVMDGNKIFKYTMSSSFDISTASFDSQSQQITATANSLRMSRDGFSAYTQIAGVLYEFSMTSAFDVTTIDPNYLEANPKLLYQSNGITAVAASYFAFSKNGTRLFNGSGNNGANLVYYNYNTSGLNIPSFPSSVSGVVKRDEIVLNEHILLDFVTQNGGTNVQLIGKEAV